MSEKMSAAQLRIALAKAEAEEAKEKEARFAEQEENRRLDRLSTEARVKEFREAANDDASVGNHREWLSLNVDYWGGLVVTVYEETNPQTAITLNATKARELRDHLNRLIP